MAPKIIPDSVRDVVEYDPHTGKISGRKPTKTKAGYWHVTINYQRYYVHRLAWFLVHGEQPEYIDHINRNPADNRLCNLRNVSNQINSLNNGSRGVCWTNSKWVAYHASRPVYQGKSILLAHYRRYMAVIATHNPALPAPPTGERTTRN